MYLCPTQPELSEDIRKLSGDCVLSSTFPIAGELLAEDMCRLWSVHLVLFQEGTTDHNLNSLLLLTTSDLGDLGENSSNCSPSTVSLEHLKSLHAF